MRVRLKVDITGTYDGKDWPKRGDEVELDDVHALDMIRAGYAVVAEEQFEDTRVKEPEVEVRTPAVARKPARRR